MCVCVCVFCLFICVLYCLCTYGSQKRVSDLLELELLIVVSLHVSAWHQSWVLCKRTCQFEREIGTEGAGGKQWKFGEVMQLYFS